MQYRHLYPMVRILLPFMAGIIVCLLISTSGIIPLHIWISLLLLTLVTVFNPVKKWLFVNRWGFGLVVNLFLFVCGYNSVIIHKEIFSPYHFSKIQNQGTFIASVAEPFQEKDHSYKTILIINGLKKGNSIINAEGRILTYLAKDSLKMPPPEGSIIVFSGNIQEIKPPQNPGAFDYRKYMATNNVYHQVYLNNSSWKTLKKPQGINLFRAAHEISRKFVGILNKNGLEGKEIAVASALILGQSDMLDNETRQAYSGSGVMHILSVSGLHVGVIYFIVNFLLGFIRNKKGLIFLKTAVIILIIWAYALLTGMSPSVMRAAAMFTFISLGNASKRNVHIINSLSVSALVLLLIDPLMISNVGFQLSYIAILGIIFINNLIAELWEPDTWIAQHIWGLISVSIAAQIATAPLAMLYFHQFPVYFIPANLVAIDVSFFAIVSGVAVIITSFLPSISNVFGIVTNYLIYVLNYCVTYIEHLPYSVMHFDSIFTAEMILIYLTIAAFLLFIYVKKRAFILIALGLLFLLSASFMFTQIIRQKQQKIIFYSTNKQSALGFINGRQQILLADSLLISDETANKFQIEGAKFQYGINNTSAFALDTVLGYYRKLPKELTPLHSLGNNLLFHNKRIVIIDSIPKPIEYCVKLKVDYLVIRNNPKIRIKDLIKLYQPGIVVIDGSNSFYRTDKWLTECSKAGLKVYSIKNTGALIVDL